LHGLPFGALNDGERCVAERWRWARIGAPDVDLRRSPNPGGQLVACAATRASAEFPALGPGVAYEVAAIADFLPGSQMVDNMFTRATLREALGSATVLHVASHFAPEPGRLEQSRLLLGDGTTVSLGELIHFGLSQLDLIVLSACDSGSTDGIASEGSFATDAMLLQGGARATIGMLWPVDSESTHATKRWGLPLSTA
jgi:CHAT domain-containing protein